MTAQEKLEILQQVLKKSASVSSVCRDNKISRKTFYSRKKKYEAVKTRGKSTCLESRRLKGLQHPRGTKDRFKNEVLRLVTLYPEYGSHRISQSLSLRLGNHGVYTLLKELGLETSLKRKEFVSLYKSPLRLLSEARKRVVEEVILAGRRVNEVANEYKVSRKTLWKWAKRYKIAQEARSELILALKDQNPTGSAHPRGTPAWLEKKILDWVVKSPEYSSHKLAAIIPEVGNHGIQNVLFRNSLNTFNRRLEYARLHVPAVQVQPAVSWLDRLRSVWETFVPQVAPAPPPGFKKIGKALIVSFVSASVLTLLFIFWLSMFAGQPFSVKFGLFFATIALSVGTFFFLYSMKYYFTLALVLSFSRQPGEGGRGRINW